MQVKRFFGLLISVLFLVGVAAGIYFSSQDKQTQDAAEAAAHNVEVVKGLIGSEKEAFLTDPRVTAILRKRGFELQVSKAGSREISSRPDLKSFDFGYPAGAPGAIKLQQVTGAKTSIPTYYTVMAIASWESLVPVLEANGLVSRRDGHYYIIDMRRLLEMVGAGNSSRTTSFTRSGRASSSHRPMYANRTRRRCMPRSPRICSTTTT